MNYYILSYSHKNTDISLREKLAFEPHHPQYQAFLQSLIDNKFIQEAIILSTCNRTEFILYASHPSKAEEFLLSKLSDYSQISIQTLKQRADFYQDLSAIHHLFSVASSLDSLVVGETQITGQLKNAFHYSYEKGFCALGLSRALHFAFKCAAKVRNSTEISKNSISVASTAILKAKTILGSLEGIKTLVIGAGEMSGLALKHLLSHRAQITLVNRDIHHARELAQSLEKEQAKNPQAKIQIESFGKLGSLLSEFVLLFSATGAPHSIITHDMITPAKHTRYWFDLALPRDIEPIEDETIKLFGVDDLEDIVKKNLSLREEQASLAYGIIGQFTQEFFIWLQSLQVEPIIKAMRQSAKQAATKELHKGIAKGFLPKEYEKNIEKTLLNAFNAFLHTPTIGLKNIANTPKGDSIIEAARFLFEGQEDASMLESYKCQYQPNKG